MKRLPFAIAGLLVLLTSTESGADPGHDRPRITMMRWKAEPVTANEPGCEKKGTCAEEILVIRAHDPDSSITEVQVWFDEGGDRAPFVFAHTYCVQGRELGTPARLEIGASFSEPGTYTVAAVAYSHKRCLPHERGDGHAARHSRVYRLETEVLAPE
jgi:hypothetical protein